MASEASTAMAAQYTITSSPATTNANNNEVIANDIADVSTTFGQQGPTVETQYHPQEARSLHTVGLDMESSTSTTVAVTPKNSTTSNLDATTITTAVVAVETTMASEGLFSNVVANKSDKTNHVNKYNNNNNNNNNNNCTNNSYCNNNSDSTVDSSGACDDVESEERTKPEPQRMTDLSSRQILPTLTSSNTTDASSSSTEAAGDENIPTRAFEDASNNSSAPPPYSSSSSTGPAEAPTTRSTPTRRSTPIPSLELQPEVTFQQLQQERQAGISGTPNTTPTSAIMRTPPSPRAAAVILPLPRVTVTSPSDVSPPCHGSNITLTMDEEDATAHSPPSPQSPTSPTIPLTPPPTPPPPLPRSVVIIPMTGNPMLTTANGMVGIGMLDQPQDLADMPPPPPYEGLVKADDSNRQSGNYGLSHMDTLPSYAVATDLPTYEEAERAKANEMRENPLMSGNRDQTTSSHLSNSTQQSGGSRYPDDDRVPAYDPYHLTGVSIGTDWIFLCTFAISFLFNWLGFLISLCITNTVAGRCGALSGLGLSMVKWVVIMKHNTMAQGFLQGDSWVWWILMVCGFLLFLRGCIQYVNMKYEWKRIFSRLQQMYFSWDGI